MASLPAKEMIVALDCEMVGVGPSGRESALARCSIVDGHGKVMYNSFVKPKDKIIDFRTKYSGIRAKDLANAKTLQECQRDVAQLLHDKILVGHALKNDLDALFLSHPRSLIRDTAKYKPLMRQGRRKPKPQKLRDLAKHHLGTDIQENEHSSIEDAITALNIYLAHQATWEASIQRSSSGLSSPRRRRRQKTSSTTPS